MAEGISQCLSPLRSPGERIPSERSSFHQSKGGWETGQMKSLENPQCLSELLCRLEQIGPDTPRRWGKMTAAQMICHLSDCFLAVMGDKPMEIPQGFSLSALMKWVPLYMPMKWPHGVPTRPEFDQLGGGGTPPARVRSRYALPARFHEEVYSPAACIPLPPSSHVQADVGTRLDALGIPPRRPSPAPVRPVARNHRRFSFLFTYSRRASFIRV